MQNAYNTPAKQMERLKAAGLNPALMYGQGNVGNAMQLSGVQKANVQGPQLAQSAAAGAQISLVNAQRKLMQEQAEAAKKDAATRMFEAMTNRKSYQLKEIFQPYEINQMKASISKTFQDIAESKVRVGTYEADIALKNAQIKLTDAQKVQATANANRLITQRDLDLEILKEYEQGFSRNLQKTVSQFFGVPDIKEATFIDKASMLISLTPFLPGGPAAAKGISAAVQKVYNYIKKLIK
jgi:hypothetical protein